MGEEKKYDGDYKVALSDKGRVNFNLNFKWLIAILISVIGFIGYFVIDKYYNTPMNELRKENIELKKSHDKLDEKNENLRNIIQQLTENQKILLDRSDRIEEWLFNNLSVSNGNRHAPEINESNIPNTSAPPSN